MWSVAEGLYVPLSSEEAGVYLPDRSWTPTTAVGKSPAGVQMRGNASTPGGHLGFPRATLPAAPEPDDTETDAKEDSK